MIASGVLRRLPIVHELLLRPAARQLIRYAIAGFCVTQFAAAIYATLAMTAHVAPLTANLMSTLCGLVMGYMVHSRWSFASGSATCEYGKIGRFLLSSLLAFLVNSLWVWLLVTRAQLSPLAPIPLMMVATPCASFLINRYWVFRAA
ncbi:MAG: GtrA family protein [Sphingomicrobium sp.]